MGLELAGPPAARRSPARLPARQTSEKYVKIFTNVMNRVQVCPFGLILRQDGAMASRNPLECLPAPKTAKRYEQMRKMPSGPPGLFYLPPQRGIAILGVGEEGY